MAVAKLALGEPVTNVWGGRRHSQSLIRVRDRGLSDSARFRVLGVGRHSLTLQRNGSGYCVPWLRARVLRPRR